jgi:hypothetical protein
LSMSAANRPRSPTRSCVSSKTGNIKPAGLCRPLRPARERTDDHDGRPPPYPRVRWGIDVLLGVAGDSS